MKKQMKRGAFSPYLKCRLDLYNSPDIQQLRHDKAAEGFGCLMVIALDLSRNSDGIGTWDMIGGYAQICRKSKLYIMSIIKDYGLFDYNDAIFVCKIVSRSFAIESSLDSPSDDHEDCMISTRTRRADMSAGSAQKDNDNHHDKKEKQKKCVCLNDTHSAFEILRAGKRFASHGQPLPDDAPPQRRRNDMYSYIRHDWVSAEEFNKEAELTIYRQLQEKEAI